MKDTNNTDPIVDAEPARERVEIREIHHYHDHHRYWEHRITSALTLITIGLVLLLNTTGVLSWSVWWEFIKFWPAFIICAGIGLVLSFSRITKFIADVVCYLIFVFIMFLAAINTGSTAFSNTGILSPQLNFWPFYQNISTTQYDVHEDVLKGELPAASILNLFVNNKVGSFTLSGLQSDNVVFSKDYKADPYLTFSSGYNNDIASDNTLYYHVQQDAQQPNFYLGNNSAMDLKVNNSYEKIYFNGTFGAGDTVLNFNNSLKLDSVTVDTGAGQLAVNIDQDSTPNSMILKVGAGKMIVTLPAAVGYSLNYQVGVGAVRINNSQVGGGLGTNSFKQSDNWSSAVKKITINVNVGVGEFDLVTK
jgi:hypothetical protein